jgi:hypothetical protein
MSDLKPEGLHLLHVFPTFAAGGRQFRVAGIMNGLGSNVRHTVVSLDGNLQAAAVLGKGIPFGTMPPPSGKGELLYPLAFRRLVRSGPESRSRYSCLGYSPAARGTPLSPAVRSQRSFVQPAIALQHARDPIVLHGA